MGKVGDELILITEIQIKNTVRHHFTQRWLQYKKIINVGKNGEKNQNPYTLLGVQNSAASSAVPQKVIPSYHMTQQFYQVHN